MRGLKGGKLMLLAVAVLVLGAIYGFVTYDPEAWTDEWYGHGNIRVVSGACSRDLSWLPTLSVDPPEFIEYDGKTYVRRQGTKPAPEGMRFTSYTRRNWHLMKAGDMLYIQPVAKVNGENVPLPDVIQYAPGSCG